ncbi:MAG TPA: chloride channel protein, partial [Planctomycetota bacterium]|nr:chloride channel protein [Planctomycetota bacterium]
VGIAGGLLGNLFQEGLLHIQDLLTGVVRTEDYRPSLSQAVREHLSWWQTLLMPTVGGLVAGLVLLALRGKKAPFGISDLVVLVHLRKGMLRFRESVVQTLSSACTIVSGGSIGKEGSNLQIAATVASLLGRATRLGSRAKAVLIGCGVAAGMATSYNAPIASAIFVMEAVLGNFAMDVFAPIVVASVMATMVRHMMFGEIALYDKSAHAIAELPWALVLAAMLLGVLCGIGSILFRAALIWGKRTFRAVRLPMPCVLALGGLLVGAIGTFMPQTWGNGFEVIGELAKGTPGVGVIATLFAWKLAATVATVGSGGLGGIFTPNLVIGAAFGAFFAYLLGFVTTITPGESTTFVFVGMAGLMAATMHAPVTAVVIVFELTGHYELTLPVMLCSIVASITASLLVEDSYYTAAIKAKGEQLPSGIEDLAIRSTYVRDVLRRDCPTVRATARFAEVMNLLGTHRGDTIYVQDDEGAVSGRIELQDVKSFLNDPSPTSAVIAADLTRPAVTVTPDQSIAAVMPLFDDPELREMAVVAAAPPRRLLGRICHQDVLTLLGSEVLGQQRRNLRFGANQALSLPQGYFFRTIDVPDAWIGHAVDALPADMREEIVVVMALVPGANGEQVAAATPELVLQAGWRIAVLGTRNAFRRLQQGAPASEG